MALQSANDAYSVNLPLTIESSGLFLNASTQGFVGIGTNTPQSTLDVRAGANRHLLVRSPAELGLGVAGVALQSADDLSRVNLPISVESSGLYLNVSTQGRVGIGTTNPQAQLHVAGSVQADGNIAAKYQDIAEWVPAVTKLSQGVVVVIDPGLGSRVQASDRPYDVHVVGVVSDRPGVLLGESADDKVKIAHSGRVKVKVDASYGPVVPGDLLVTSPTRGHAMRSTPVAVGEASLHRPGTLIGKALEPLNEGQGEILVLLILQ